MYHSQIGQDKFVVEEIFQRRRDLTFCDVGAYDGVKFSNTLFMERELGWTGICIEPMPEQFAKLQAVRKGRAYQCCVSDFDGESEFTMIEGHKDSVTMLSGLSAYIEGRSLDRINALTDNKRRVIVPVRRLSAILRECGFKRLDYLSIDAEGAEPRILTDIFDAGIDIGCLSVEQNFGDRKSSQILKARGYREVKVFDGYDFVFCRDGVGPT